MKGIWKKMQVKKSRELSRRQQFYDRLNTAKRELEASVTFYPYSTWGNLTHLDHLLSDVGLLAEDVLVSRSINDIGGADGDIAFYCEFLGASKVNLVDHAPTNFNGLVGAMKLKEALNSSVNIIDIDIDLDTSNGWEILEEAETSIFLGILYHLQNPFLALSQLSKKSKYLLLSTRVFDVLNGMSITDRPCAYFYNSGESNNDPTNWWCFTDECLKRMIDRSGWEIIAYKRMGCDKNADPVDSRKDGRAFAYLKSKSFNNKA